MALSFGGLRPCYFRFPLSQIKLREMYRLICISAEKLYLIKLLSYFISQSCSFARSLVSENKYFSIIFWDIQNGNGVGMIKVAFNGNDGHYLLYFLLLIGCSHTKLYDKDGREHHLSFSTHSVHSAEELFCIFM